MKIEGKELTYTATLVVAPSDSLHRHHADYVMDGTDDHLDIIQAIADLPATGGKIIILDGTADIRGDIVIDKDNVVIEGQGINTILLVNPSISSHIQVFSGTSKNNFAIKNMKIDLNRAAITGDYYSVGVWMDSCTDARIDGVTIVSNAIDSGWTEYGMIVTYSCVRPTVTNCFFGDVNNYALVDKDTTDYVVDRNSFVGETDAYIFIEFMWGASYSKRARVTNNFFDGWGRNGAYANGVDSNSEDALIADNIFYDCNDYMSIEVRGPNSVVDGNVIAVGAAAISLYEPNCIVSNNVFDTIENTAINLESSTLVIGNVIENVTENSVQACAIKVTDTKVWIINNLIRNVQRDGIWIRHNDGDDGRSFIIGNWIDNCSAAAANTYDDIHINQPPFGNYSGVYLMHNILLNSSGNAKYLIDVSNASINDTVVKYNNLHDAGATAKINDAGTGTIIRDNVGYITEAWGTATIANGTNSITVAHGLSTTPTVVFPTGQHEETRDCIVTNIGAANFDIETGDGVNVTGDRTVMWYAYGGKP